MHEEQLIKAREQQKRIAEVEWDVGREAEERRLFVERKMQEREEQARLYFRANFKRRIPEFVPHDETSKVDKEYRREMARLQEQFEEELESYHFERNGKPKLSKPQKRAQLLDQLIDAIPMQQLQRAFQSPTSPKLLWALQRPNGFKESNKEIYMDLRELFGERY